MKLLCLSTAESGCSLAILDGTILKCEEFWEARLTHSKRLIQMIDHMLENRAEMELSDMDAFVAANGPGSFTGLRIGISVVKGLAYAMGKPAAGVSSLDGVAFRFVHSSLPVCVMMDARRGEVYCAVYQFDHGRLVWKSQEKVLSPVEAVAMTDGVTLFAGSGSKVYKEIIEQTAENPTFTPVFSDTVSATALAGSLYANETFMAAPEKFLTENDIQPNYIRKSDAQLQFVEK